MNTDNTKKNGRSLSKVEAAEVSGNSKLFHQLFNVYLTLIFLTVTGVFALIFWLLTAQYKHSQSIVDEQVMPLKLQLIEQSYLINTDTLLKKIVTQAQFDELTPLLNDLTVQSKKLSLLTSKHTISYKQWFANNKLGINIINEVEGNHPNNELIKTNMLILLDTLIDAIDVELGDGDILRKQKEILNKAQNDLLGIVLKLNALSLTSTFSDFLTLSEEVNNLFSEDYGKQLATHKNGNEKLEEIIKDFLRLEDLIVKRGILSRWEQQLELIHNYQLKIVEQQKELQHILVNLSARKVNDANLPVNTVKNNKDVLPLWLVVFFLVAISLLLFLLLLLRHKIKVVSKINAHCIKEVINNSKTFTQNDNNNTKLLTTESLQLIKNIKHVVGKSYSQIEYLALSKKNKALQNQLEKNESLHEKLLDGSELVSSNGEVMDQQCLNDLQLFATKLLVLSGSNALKSKHHNIEIGKGNVTCDNLYETFTQGRYLLRKLRQINNTHFLQSEVGVLTLSDINIAAQIHAIFYNFHNTLEQCQNTASVHIDEKINVGVTFDADLFTEMLNIFISLSFAQQCNSQLKLSVILTDKNNGQQTLSFTSEVVKQGETLPLPECLNKVNGGSESQSDQIDYFTLLLNSLHGTELFAKSNEKGYQLAFTLPVASSNDNVENYYPPQEFPALSTVLENQLTMPVEILLAVKEPKTYQSLQQIIHSLGLQVTFVTNEIMLNMAWRSGRYAVLMTDIDCQPFIRFMIDELDNSTKIVAMPRAVFNLSKEASVSKVTDAYSHWLSGNISVDININELKSIMTPWIKEPSDKSKEAIKVASGSFSAEAEAIKNNISSESIESSFDIEQYIKNQGSVELALFMLEEYADENIALVEKLNASFNDNDMDKFKELIQQLQVNSNILSADDLIELCQQWSKIIDSSTLDNTSKQQQDLLVSTQHKVRELSHFSEGIA